MIESLCSYSHFSSEVCHLYFQMSLFNASVPAVRFIWGKYQRQSKNSLKKSISVLSVFSYTNARKQFKRLQFSRTVVGIGI